MLFIHLFIILKTFKFTSSFLFGIHILLDKSSRVLQLPLYTPKLAMKWVVVQLNKSKHFILNVSYVRLTTSIIIN